jgi:hypothetical protein
MENPPEDHQQPILPDDDHEPVLAWEMPGNIFTRIWLTLVQVLINPSSSFERLGPPGYLQPYLLALIPASIFAIISVITDPIPELLEMQKAGAESVNIQGGLAYFLFDNYSYVQLFNLLITPFSLVLAIFFTAGPLHLFLRIFKYTGRPFMATYKVVTYCAAAAYSVYAFYSIVFSFFFNPIEFVTQAQPVNLFPFFVMWAFGMSIGIWTFIVGLKGLAKIHQTTKGRVFLAGLCGTVAVALCWFIIWIPIMSRIAANA